MTIRSTRFSQPCQANRVRAYAFHNDFCMTIWQVASRFAKHIAFNMHIDVLVYSMMLCVCDYGREKYVLIDIREQ